MTGSDEDRGRSRRLGAEDQRWSSTGRVLGGLTIEKSGDAVCGLKKNFIRLSFTPLWSPPSALHITKAKMSIRCKLAHIMSPIRTEAQLLQYWSSRQNDLYQFINVRNRRYKYMSKRSRFRYFGLRRTPITFLQWSLQNTIRT
jgi:hypothetical protein